MECHVTENGGEDDSGEYGKKYTDVVVAETQHDSFRADFHEVLQIDLAAAADYAAPLRKNITAATTMAIATEGNAATMPNIQRVM